MGLGGLFFKFFADGFADEFAAISVFPFSGCFQIADHRFWEVNEQCSFADWLLAFRVGHEKHVIYPLYNCNK